MKKKMGTDTLLVALDIGTTKMCVLVAQPLSDNSLNIIGIGKAPSYGVSRGIVVDIAQAVHAIKLAVKEAELMSGYKIEHVVVGISGAHIQAINSHGMVPIKQGRVKPQDVTAVLQAAKAVVIPEGMQILHVLPQYYIIDAQQKVLDPVGMFGVRLEAQAHIIMGSVASVQNLINCCELAGITVTDIILEPLASAEAVLSKDEKELGVGILDIGGGTSDFALYQQGAIRHTKIISIAGNYITHDIALCLRTTLKDAERIKKEFGVTQQTTVDLYKSFEVEMVHGNELKQVLVEDLTSIIEPRVAELFSMVHQEITQQHIKHLMAAGLVLTGGGSLLQGIQKTAQDILQIPVRVGNPHVPTLYRELLESPMHATGYGLLLYMLKTTQGMPMEHLCGPLISRIFWRMKTWVSDFF